MVILTVTRRLLALRRYRILTVLLLLWSIPGSFAAAQILNGRFITSAYTWEKFDTVNVSKTILRGFQSAIFDVTQGNFALSMHFQAAPILQHGLGDAPDYRMYYLYARMKNLFDSSLDVSVGRMPYFAGVGNGTIDGALTTLHVLENRLRVTAYGGANVPLDLAVQNWGPLKDNFTFGGQVLTTAIPDARLGLSYSNKQRSRPGYWAVRTDSLFNPVPQFIEPEPLKEQLVSADGAYWVDRLYFYGRYDYNIDNKKTQRGQAGVRYYTTNMLNLSFDYIHRAPRVMFNSFFTVFNASNTDEIEAGVDYMLRPSLRAFARVGYVEYIDDRSFRYTAGLVHSYVSLTYRGGDGYAGDMNSASIQATYPFFQNLFMPTCGFTLISYRLNSLADREDAIAATLGAILRPLQTLSFDVQGQWLTTKITRDDFRLFVKLNYWFTQRMNFLE